MATTMEDDIRRRAEQRLNKLVTAMGQTEQRFKEGTYTKTFAKFLRMFYDAFRREGMNEERALRLTADMAESYYTSNEREIKAYIDEGTIMAEEALFRKLIDESEELKAIADAILDPLKMAFVNECNFSHGEAENLRALLADPDA